MTVEELKAQLNENIGLVMKQLAHETKMSDDINELGQLLSILMSTWNTIHWIEAEDARLKQSASLPNPAE